MFTFELDDANFIAVASIGLNGLEHDTHNAAKNAADEGVKEEQRDHPYVDRTQNLTGSAHVEPADDGGPGFDMVWPAEYASFVNQGTSRAAAFPFTPIAENRAEQVLKYDLANGIEEFKAKVRG